MKKLAAPTGLCQQRAMRQVDRGAVCMSSRPPLLSLRLHSGCRRDGERGVCVKRGGVRLKGRGRY